MGDFQKKELKYSVKTTVEMAALVLGLFLVASIAPMVIFGVFDISYFFEKEFISEFLIILAVAGIMIGVGLYQRSNNVLEYGDYGFYFEGKTYSYNMVSKLIAVHRGRNGTFYHLHVGEEVIYKFSTIYENKDDFIATLQKNGVLIIA